MAMSRPGCQPAAKLPAYHRHAASITISKLKYFRFFPGFCRARRWNELWALNIPLFSFVLDFQQKKNEELSRVNVPLGPLQYRQTSNEQEKEIEKNKNEFLVGHDCDCDYDVNSILRLLHNNLFIASVSGVVYVPRTVCLPSASIDKHAAQFSADQTPSASIYACPAKPLHACNAHCACVRFFELKRIRFLAFVLWSKRVVCRPNKHDENSKCLIRFTSDCVCSVYLWIEPYEEINDEITIDCLSIPVVFHSFFRISLLTSKSSDDAQQLTNRRHQKIEFVAATHRNISTKANEKKWVSVWF